jgi:hypothetical protein
MKANEMRYGNYYCYDGIIFKHNYIDFTLVIIDTPADRYCLDVEEIQPIPLTEEWLLKFGFEKEKPDYLWWRLNGVTINVFNGEAYKLNTGGYTFYRHFKHVHQLQNLYFALTGEELTLKEI